MGEDSLLERITAATEERQLSQNTLTAYRRTWLKAIAWAAGEGLALETLPVERVGEFDEEATRGLSASHHLQVKAALALLYHVLGSTNPFAECRQLALVGLQLRIINGVVSLLTTEVHNRALAAYLSEQTRASANSGLTTATLEVLACIAFKQPISQTEIDHLFDADKRGLVVTLRDLRLVEEFAGTDGRLRFATTQTFLQRFGLASFAGLAAASFLASPPATQPLI
jgi:hypothetical protein